MVLFCVEFFIRGLAYFLIFIWILYFLNSMNSNFYDMSFILLNSHTFCRDFEKYTEDILGIYWDVVV